MRYIRNTDQKYVKRVTIRHVKMEIQAREIIKNCVLIETPEKSVNCEVFCTEVPMAWNYVTWGMEIRSMNTISV
jgi:hypothetical protein